MAGHDWEGLLGTWSRQVIATKEEARKLPDEVVASGWLGFPGAGEEQIARAEARLGVRLPPSYRAFLAVSNGWRTTGTFVDRVYPVEEIDWFRTRNQEWIDAYVNPIPPPLPFSLFRPSRAPRLSDAEYFVYGEAQDPARFRQEYLQTALQVSEEGDSAVYLLNPEVVTPDGEWEAWFFANWLPGASRYRSFWDLMRAEHESFLNLR